MLALLSLILLTVFPFRNNADQGPPSPGYHLTSVINSIDFDQGFKNLWGPQHQELDDGTLTIRLDKTSGSGFKSRERYSSGYFGAAIKLRRCDRSAGVDASIYLSSSEDYAEEHDEIDIEFLGNIKDKPYVLQTNVYVRGASGYSNTLGREMKFHLWFDPTEDFHSYAILWNPTEIIFFVDDVPIRIYPRKSKHTFPSRPMYVYGSIWDASSWATDNGKHIVDYTYEPFMCMYKNFKISGCDVNSATQCNPVSGHPYRSTELSHQQNRAMKWAQHNYMIYNYCTDKKRDHSLTPECYMG